MTEVLWMLAVLVCLAAAAFGFYQLPEAVRTEVQSYQTLIGALIALATAIIAYSNISRQLQAQREAEARQRRFQRDQLASALAGEISGILYLFDHRQMISYYEEFATHVECMERAEDWWAMAVDGDYTSIYKAVSRDLGVLPRDLPERVAMFYVELKGIFDRISAAERGIYLWKTGERAAVMARVLVGEIKDAQANGRKLIEDLKQTRDPNSR